MKILPRKEKLKAMRENRPAQDPDIIRAAVIETVMAGGPGSGRHSGWGQPKMHGGGDWLETYRGEGGAGPHGTTHYAEVSKQGEGYRVGITKLGKYGGTSETNARTRWKFGFSSEKDAVSYANKWLPNKNIHETGDSVKSNREFMKKIQATQKTGDISNRDHLEKKESAVRSAIKDDPRFNSGTPSYPGCKSYLVDTTCNDDGTCNAIVNTSEGKLVKHPFDYDDETGEVTLAPGDPEKTESSRIYSMLIEENDKIRASGNSDGAGKGNATKKSDAADEMSAEAHGLSQRAHESGDADDHSEAKEAHESAMALHKSALIASAKSGMDDKVDYHAKMMAAHQSCADGHCDDCEGIEAAMETLGDLIKAGGPGSGRKPGGGKLRGMSDTMTRNKASNSTPKDILHCAAGTPVAEKSWVAGEPVQFMYMPGGVKTITAGFRKNSSITITLEVDKDTADTIQASYESLREEMPKQVPYGCTDHDEKAASVRACDETEFVWGEYADTEGVLITAAPTKLGEDDVNGGLHLSWSPSFATDANYARAKEKDGHYYFPEGIRGSKSNPARITGIDFCFGTLTNKPAFKDMPAVHAESPGDDLDSIIESMTSQVDGVGDILKELNDSVFASAKPGKGVGEAETLDEICDRMAASRLPAT